MNFIKFILILVMLTVPAKVFAGFVGGVSTDDPDIILSAYYDLRDRSTYIQISNLIDNPNPCQIHIQIFQHDRGCSELNFFDTLTPNDTVVYDLDNLIRNDGSLVPANLLDESFGYVVVSGDIENGCPVLIGNSRIIDQADYEYRMNMIGVNGSLGDSPYANFNTIDGANQADIVGYSYFLTDFDYGVGAINNDFGFDADIFTFDLAEEPLSCDRRNFACGNVMNYGVNEDYPNSRGGPLLCPGGGLADPNGGYVYFANPDFPFPDNFDEPSEPRLVGIIGINNGDGTGSIDTWFGHD